MLSRIVTAQEREKKRQRMQMFLTIFIVVILGASTIGFALSSSDTDVKKYNKQKFYQTQQGWQGKGLDFATRYLPQDVENVTLQGSLSLDLFARKLYLVVDPPTRNIQSELYEWANIVPMNNPNAACLPEYGEDEGCVELPLKDCENADPLTTVLIFKDSNESMIKAYGSCVTIQGDNEGMLKAIDKAIYVMYGVITA